jgi:hypothetical protein
MHGPEHNTNKNQPTQRHISLKAHDADGCKAQMQSMLLLHGQSHLLPTSAARL